MASSIQELLGLTKALDRLEARIKSYRAILLDKSLGRSVEATNEDDAISTGEVETVEALIRRFARRVTEDEPAESEWEPLHPYCSRNEEKKKNWADQNYEYFRWALLWIQKTRTYLEYLSGLQAAEGEPRGGGMGPSSTGGETPKYDVTLSFAGEDRIHARKIAELLRNDGFSVFYDEYEQATLWGRNLYSHLSDVYQNRARYCLMFISANYARKLWTKRERESAQARAFRESSEYILPLRLDNTSLPGIEDTVGYIDLNSMAHEDVVRLLTEKLRSI